MLNNIEPEHPTRRERERKQRIGEILDAAKKVFARDGFEKANLDEVARMCELSKGAIYYYFESKEDLFKAILNKGLKENMNSVNKAKEMASIREGIHKIIEDALFFFQRDYDFLSLFFLEPKAIHTKIALEKGGNLFNCMDAIIKDIKVIFKKGIEKAEIKSYDPVILSYFLIGFLHTFAMHSKIDPKKGAKVLTEIFFEGIKNYPEKIS